MWHFTSLAGTLRYGDGREVGAGETLTVDGEIAIGKRGLHACPRIIDALEHAHGPRLWEVELSSERVDWDDLSVATEMTPLRDYGNMSALIARFTQWCERRAKSVPAFEAAVAASDAANHAASMLALAMARLEAPSDIALAEAATVADQTADAINSFVNVPNDEYADVCASADYAAERQRQERWWHLALLLACH